MFIFIKSGVVSARNFSNKNAIPYVKKNFYQRVDLISISFKFDKLL